MTDNTHNTFSVRPYSQDELKDMQQKLYRNLRLGKMYASHEKCKHFYLVKENGRKERDMIEQNSKDTGNCSVCWKLDKMDKECSKNSTCDLESSDNVHYMVTCYMDTFYKEPPRLTYDNVNLQGHFYSWLYEHDPSTTSTSRDRPKRERKR